MQRDRFPPRCSLLFPHRDITVERPVGEGRHNHDRQLRRFLPRASPWHIQQIVDSTAIVIWKRKNNLLFCLVTPSSIGPIDILATSALDSFEYSLGARYSRCRVVWTSTDSVGIAVLWARDIDAYPKISFADPETLFTFAGVSNPYLVFGWSSYEGDVLFDTDTVGGRDVFAWSGGTIQNLSSDPDADDSHGRAYINPFITKTSGARESSWFIADILAVEKNTREDSTLVFLRDWFWTDTVKSRGHNRNISFGSNIFYSPDLGRLCIQSVWESNRTGRSHIYARKIAIPTDDVSDNQTISQAFELQQNYPNPFNPNTTIRLQAGRAEHITLKIFDLLGRETAVLWDGDVSPGMYSFPWNATGFPTGVYFARLTASPFTACRKLLLLR